MKYFFDKKIDMILRLSNAYSLICQNIRSDLELIANLIEYNIKNESLLDVFEACSGTVYQQNVIKFLENMDKIRDEQNGNKGT